VMTPSFHFTFNSATTNGSSNNPRQSCSPVKEVLALSKLVWVTETPHVRGLQSLTGKGEVTHLDLWWYTHNNIFNSSLPYQRVFLLVTNCSTLVMCEETMNYKLEIAPLMFSYNYLPPRVNTKFLVDIIVLYYI
jgi:hypothetical protein